MFPRQRDFPVETETGEAREDRLIDGLEGKLIPHALHLESFSIVACALLAVSSWSNLLVFDWTVAGFCGSLAQGEELLRPKGGPAGIRLAGRINGSVRYPAVSKRLPIVVAVASTIDYQRLKR